MSEAKKVWREKVTDALNRQKWYDTDAYGRTVHVAELDLVPQVWRTMTHVYDRNGNLTQVHVDPIIDTAPPTHVVAMSYDWLGRKLSMADPDMGNWSYVYDRNGNLTEQTDGRNKRIKFEFDAHNRMTAKKECTGAGSPPSCSSTSTLATYVYDSTTGGNVGKGRRTSVTDLSGSTSWVYDSRGRATSETKVISGSSYTTTYAYDGLSRQTSVTLPNSEVVTLGYTPRGLPNSVSSSLSSTIVSSTTYNRLGSRRQTALGNTVTETRDYWGIDYTGTPANQNFGLLRKISNDSTGQTDLTYSWDVMGNMTSRATNLGGTNYGTESFTYDFLDRVLTGNASSAPNSPYNESYSYDAHDNLASKTGNGEYLYGAGNGPVTAGLVHYWPLDDGAVSSSALSPGAYDRAGTVTLAAQNGPARISTGDAELLQAYSFPNDDDRLYGTGATLGTTAFSISGWVRLDSGNSLTKQAMGLGDVDNATVYVGPNSQDLKLQVKISSGWYYGTFGTLTLGQWAHFAWTYDGASVTLYLNGAYAATITQAGSITFGGTEVTLGMTDPTYTNSEWPGAVDEMRIYDRPLSAWEVSLLYGYTPAAAHRLLETPTGTGALSSGLSHYWNMDRGAVRSTTIQDVAGSADLTAYNSPLHSASGDAELKEAFEFPGSDDHLHIASGVTLGATAVTVSGWVRLDSVDATNDMHAVGLGNLDNALVKVNNNSQTLRVKVKIGSTSYTKSFGDLTLGQWAHFAYTYDGSQLKVYRDGALNNTTTDSGGISFGGSEATIGIGDPTYTSNEWPGAVDEVRIYNRALSATEVSQLHSFTPVVYAYDGNGNTTSRPSANGTQTLTWNAENQLSGVTWAGGSESYIYDGDGKRVSRNAGGVTTHYVNQWYEKVVGGATTTSYWLGAELVAVRDSAGPTVMWVHTDSLGSPAAWTASGTSKTTSAIHAYLPWGGTRYTTGATYTARDFTGQLKDASSGLHFYNARYYDSVLGRFLSPDTIVPDPADPSSFNRYSYVLNNPLKYTDPTGNNTCGGSPATNPDPSCDEWQFTDAQTFMMSLGQTANFELPGWLEAVVEWLGPAVFSLPDFAASVRNGDVLGAAAALAAAAPGPDYVKFARKALGKGADEAVDAASHLIRRSGKTDDILSHLGTRDLEAARRELNGEVVGFRPDGQPWDHVQEVRNAQQGIRNRIGSLMSDLADPKTQSNIGLKALIQNDISFWSTLLDITEQVVPPK
jgi:RHS repeat-associated protein